MAHFAKVENGIVREVIVVGNNDAPTEAAGKTFIASIGLLGDWVQTSYNTYRDNNGVSRHRTGGIPFRGQYAGIGDRYDAKLDEFVVRVVEDAPE